MRTLFCSFNYFDGIALTKEDAKKCSHQGQCDNDVLEILEKSYVKKQLAAINSEKLARELKEYGAWDSEELKDRKANDTRIVWIAAGNIVDELA